MEGGIDERWVFAAPVPWRSSNVFDHLDENVSEAPAASMNRRRD